MNLLMAFASYRKMKDRKEKLELEVEDTEKLIRRVIHNTLFVEFLGNNYAYYRLGTYHQLKYIADDLDQRIENRLFEAKVKKVIDATGK